jgi:hypothetical protein
VCQWNEVLVTASVFPCECVEVFVRVYDQRIEVISLQEVLESADLLASCVV